MAIINVGFIGLLGIIAAIDLRTLKIPLWSLFAVVAMIFIKGGFELNDLLFGFALMLASVFASDSLLRRETLGGGDLWIGTGMSCFMGFDRFLIAYTVAALAGSIAMMTVYRHERILSVAYVPYLAAGAFWAMFIAKI